MWEVLGLAGGVPKLLHLVVRHSCGMEMEKWQGEAKRDPYGNISPKP